MQLKTMGTFKVSNGRIGKWRLFTNKMQLFYCGNRNAFATIKS